MESYYKTLSAVNLKKIFNETKTVSVALLESDLFQELYETYDSEFETLVRNSTNALKRFIQDNEEVEDMIFDEKEKMIKKREKNKETKLRIEKKERDRIQKKFQTILSKDEEEMKRIIIAYVNKLNKSQLDDFVVKNEINVKNDDDDEPKTLKSVE